MHISASEISARHGISLMDKIVEMRFGSHLYGTSTPQSDLDLKAVFIPEARDILLQQVINNINVTPEKEAGARNVAGDVDIELFSLQRYLTLLAEGQTLALDMLFAPDSAMTIEPSLIWREIQANSGLLITRRASNFVRYCRQQANKYGIKGSRIAVARHVLSVLEAAEATYGTTARLSVAEAEISAFAGALDYTTLVDRETPSGQIVRHLAVCDKMMPFTSSLRTAKDVVQRVVDSYGQRALQAERNEGVDWKALSHAVRVGREALELFETGRITFPLTYAAEILSIKQGEFRYESVAELIEGLLSKVEAASQSSGLREEPDQGFIDDLVARVYRGKVIGCA